MAHAPIEIHVVESPQDLEACFSIRRLVFVEEQNVPLELELDDLDAIATHFLARLPSGDPIACARCYPKDDTLKIGRVAVLPSFRGQGIGLAVMQFVLAWAAQKGYASAALDSQTHALAFYERLGFIAFGPEFDDAGIPHRHMTKALAASSFSPGLW
jgi:ElaA protein